MSLNNRNMVVNCIVVVSLIYLKTSAVEGQTVGTYWSNTFIYNGVDPSIVGESKSSKSVTRCSIQCSKNALYTTLYYSSTLQLCYCNTQPVREVNASSVDTGLIYAIRAKQVQFPYNISDCLGLYQQGLTIDGVYTINPVSGVRLNAWCDMTAGGWTVIQRRQDGSQNFNRLWNDYVDGFGDLRGEFWLGLEKIHLLTTTASTLRIEVSSWAGVTCFADYSSFSVSSSADKYRLSVSGFTGNCTDRFTYHNGQKFSTPDADNDPAAGDCAAQALSGWWFYVCSESNLNGIYNSTIAWITQMNPLKTAVMKVRRNNI